MQKKITGTVISNEKIAKDTMEMVLHVPDFEEALFVPGSFAHIKIPEANELLLRRPISIHYYDFAKKELHFAYLVVGKGTKLLSQAMPGQQLDLLAPLGNGFCLNPEQKKVWLVGGGIGIAPLLSLKNVYEDREFTAFLGYKSREYLYKQEAFAEFCREVHLCTDDGSAGEKGFVTQLVAEQMKGQVPDVILACGPMPMLYALKEAVAGQPVKVLASLEEHMGCGVGGCAVCTCKIGKEDEYDYKKVCLDGPVFDLKEVL